VDTPSIPMVSVQPLQAPGEVTRFVLLQPSEHTNHGMKQLQGIIHNHTHSLTLNVSRLAILALSPKRQLSHIYHKPFLMWILITQSPLSLSWFSILLPFWGGLLVGKVQTESMARL
jgi:hypothetical protein